MPLSAVHTHRHRLRHAQQGAASLQDTLPVELVRYIIRLATDVPIAFDTRHESVMDEDRTRTRREIVESLRTKRSLSLVSKSLHILVDEYMHEIILLTRFPGCTALQLFASFLRTTRRHHTPRQRIRPRGERVRRLELDFRVNSPWTTSWDSLWGLLPACPNVELLIFQPVCQAWMLEWSLGVRNGDGPLFHGRDCLGFDHPSGAVYSVTCSEVFARTVTKKYCGTLRRLELAQSCELPEPYLQPMLSGLPNLEVIRSAHLQVSLGHNSSSITTNWSGTLPLPQQGQQLHTLLLQSTRGLKALRQPSPQLRHLSILNGRVSPVRSGDRDLLRQHAATIVSLYYQEFDCEESLPGIIDILPNLEHLRLLDWPKARWNNVFPPQIHPNLRTVTLFRTLSHSQENSLFGQMSQLVKAVEEGRLPKLDKIRLGACDHHRGGWDDVQPAFARLGITIEEREDLRPWYGSFPYR
ncbi:hypothetical protein CALCODRAFT_556714 [Calocera cornea HHB12733]|uniref:F-box domain-containing protein n=1 Tax=Calocera cornea HHB12733 TaxID=1353952 RepID=A0A165EHN7_9BASI|nr:hypothetical protein CALCODRAFT_556714 [Calocera cornea HHB12733]